MLHHLIQHAIAFHQSRSGATAIEYGLIAAVISGAVIVGVGSLGNGVGNHFKGIANKVNNYSN